jgi:hypothetical protein
MIKNKIILVPIFTSFIIFSVLISLAYAINAINSNNAISINSTKSYKPTINNNSFYCDRNCLIFVSILLILMLIIFNIYIFFHRYEKSYKLIV